MRDGEAPARAAGTGGLRNIVLVVATFYPDSYGGAERQAFILAEALARLGVRTRIVAPTLHPELGAVEPTRFGSIERIPVAHFPNYGGRRIGATLAWTREFLRRYASAEAQVDAYYVFHARLHLLPALLSAWRRGAPLFVKLGGGGEASDFLALKQKRYLYGELILRALLRRADGFVANSQEIVEDLRRLQVPEHRILPIPNGVEIPPIERLNEAIGRRTGRRFVFAGRMVKDKSVDVLFEAARAVAGRGEQLELTFLGDGPERDRLDKEVRSAGLEETVRLPGVTDDVYGHLFQSDFFVSASAREGQSNALLEAMSAGCIPIVYRASGAADLVEDGRTGFLLDSSDSESFAGAFSRVLALTPAARDEMARAAYASTAERTGVDAVAARCLEAFETLSAARSSQT
jgi:glycosyltransferase involved in cell wall biosynthesis